MIFVNVFSAHPVPNDVAQPLADPTTKKRCTYGTGLTFGLIWGNSRLFKPWNSYPKRPGHLKMY
ncbi:hypothetical protein [Gloeomargarita lithophora]|uniref:hypothetical protein n=1 Tax=Gloeomargarita lithophora TaxID=1188228 RepID=UPI00155F962B|nr:hypothetical protein [Gloeomargarita lithophora]